MSNADNPSKVSLALSMMVHICNEGVGSTDSSLKLLLLKVELKNLLKALDIAWGCCRISLFVHIKEFLTGL